MSADTLLRADPAYVEAHLGYLFAPARDTDGIIVVSEPLEGSYWRSECFAVDQPDAAARYCATRSDAGAQVYVRCTLLAERVARTKRGTTAQTAWATHLWADVDIAGAGHQPAADGLPLPPTLEQAEAIADALLPPTLLLFSGGGLYPVWMLTEAVDLRAPDARADFAALSQAWHDSLGEIGRRCGWHVDNTGDLTRVLRPAGVVNRKAGRPPNLVTVRRGYLSGGGPYALDQLRSACIAPIAPEHPRPERIARPAGQATVWDVVAELYDLGDILAADRRFGPWAPLKPDQHFDYWRRAGSETSTYSIKQNRSTGVVIVWSSVVAAALGVRPGEGLDLFGFVCRLEGTDPKQRAADLIRAARQRRRSTA